MKNLVENKYRRQEPFMGITGWILLVLVLLTAVQQVPIIQSAFYNEIRALLYAGFIIVAVSVVLFSKHLTQSKLLLWLLFGTVWVLVISLIQEVLRGQGDFSEFLLMLIPFVVYLCSSSIKYSDVSIQRFLVIYIATVVVMSIWNTLLYFPGLQISDTYAVPGKNQIGPIIGMALVAALFLIGVRKGSGKTASIWVRSIGIAAVLTLFFALVLLRNRSGLLGVIVVGCVVFFVQIVGGNIKRILLFITLSAFMLIVLGVTGQLSVLMQLIVDSFTGSIDTRDFDSLSSGRVGVYADSWEFIVRNPLFGETGTNESLVFIPHNYSLNVLVKYGFVLGLPLILFHVYLLVVSVKYSFTRVREAWQVNLAGYLLLFSMIVAQFEYSYPFGPGTSQVLLWFLLGQAGRRIYHEPAPLPLQAPSALLK